jgi:hypothetical protein
VHSHAAQARGDEVPGLVHEDDQADTDGHLKDAKDFHATVLALRTGSWDG